MLSLLCAALLALMAGDPAPTRTPAPARIAVWLSQESPPYRELLDGFRRSLQNRGIEVELEVRLLGAPDPSDSHSSPTHPAQLTLAVGTPAIRLAAKEPGSVSLIGVALRRSDLEGLPNGTGIYLEFSPDVELQWIRRVLPDLKRVGVVYNRRENGATVARAGEIAKGLGLRLVTRGIDSRAGVLPALESLANEAEVLWGVGDTLALTPETATSFLLFGFHNRIPFVGLSRAWVKAGALYALDRDWGDLGQQCAELAQQVLVGRAAGSLPSAPPRRVVYYINRNTAETMKLNLPADVLRGAKEVLQ